MFQPPTPRLHFPGEKLHKKKLEMFNSEMCILVEEGWSFWGGGGGPVVAGQSANPKKKESEIKEEDKQLAYHWLASMLQTSKESLFDKIKIQSYWQHCLDLCVRQYGKCF